MLMNRFLVGGINAVGYNRLVFNGVMNRRLFSINSRQNAEDESTSIFGSMTKNVDLNKPVPNRLSDRMVTAAEGQEEQNEDSKVAEQKLKDSVTVENDVLLQKYIQKLQQPEIPAVELYLSPLKRKIYQQNCSENGGFYKKDTIVTLPSTKQQYKLKLTKQELDALEPSVYLKSYRLKSSLKKTTQVLRMINGLDLKKAITQCHFSKRGVAKEVEELLKTGLDDAAKLKLDANDLYISQIWCGSDGSWIKRMEFKGRGRVGIITHPWVHVRCILKSKSVTKKRLEYEMTLKESKKKPWVQLADKPIRGVTNNVYKW